MALFLAKSAHRAQTRADQRIEEGHVLVLGFAGVFFGLVFGKEMVEGGGTESYD
jgi:hypothetical protein